MPLLKKYTSPLWGIWKIEESWQEIFSQLDRKELYLPFLESIISSGRKTEWLTVRLLLKNLIGVETAISYQENGIPYLPELNNQISISHTKGYAAVIIDNQKTVGIDIEYHSKRVERIQSRFLSNKELELLNKQPNTEELLVCWSAKETAFKMMKTSIVDWLTDIHILNYNPIDANKGEIILQETKTAKKQKFDVKFEITKDYVITYSF